LRWLEWLMNVNVFARFVPIIVLMIPLYVTFRRLDLLNSVWGVIIAETGFLLPYGVLILAPYFAALPQELDEAARIDGCSRFTAFLRVTLPLSTPALASYGAIVFIIAWNDLLTPLILNNRAEFMTLPVVIASLVGDVHVFFSLMMAICLVAMAPSVILVTDGDLPRCHGAVGHSRAGVAEIRRARPCRRRGERLNRTRLVVAAGHQTASTGTKLTLGRKRAGGTPPLVETNRYSSSITAIFAEPAEIAI
jgi:ABC-type Fe3+ transport system permease subunit